MFGVTNVMSGWYYKLALSPHVYTTLQKAFVINASQNISELYFFIEITISYNLCLTLECDIDRPDMAAVTFNRYAV